MDINEVKLRKARAIREMCRKCTCDQESEIKYCNLVECPLWEWRMSYHTSSPRYQRAIDAETDAEKKALLQGTKMEPDPLKRARKNKSNA